jgi:hypothetical protein
MTNRIGKTARRLNAPQVVAFAALALLALCAPGAASAQWATSSNSPNNVNNTNTGNVGIGTNAPARKLEVMAPDGEAVRLYRNGNGTNWGVNIKFALTNSNASAFDYAGIHGQVANPSAGSEGGNLVFTTATSGQLTEKMRVDSAGNIGIGTASPLSLFHLHGSSPVLRMSGSATDQHLLIAFYDNNNAAKGMVGYLGANGTGSRYTGVINISGDYEGLGTINATPIYYFINGAALHTMAANGNVGIGTLAPAAKLDVVGDIRVSGNINAKYQDVAEWVPSTQKLQAGTVVVLDTKHDNHVNASTAAYDTRVAGVVSAQPGLTLGEAGEGKALVATTGRVKVKVDATRAPIQIGDLIVTSDVEGVAMKSEPVSLGGVTIHRPGTIIGKALEALDKGTGEILVLLSLQ